ncbi:MAG TPA: hypothetical protein V6C88_01415 [Chroococcidiopsis sp.]
MPLFPTLPVKFGYRSQSEDTSIEVDVFYFSALRQKSQHGRIERFISFNQSTRQFCRVALQSQKPEASARLEYVRRRLGQDWCDRVLDAEGEIVVADPITVAAKVITILDSLSIDYYIGGSVASSLWGESCYTEDLNLIIELDETKVRPLVEAFLNASFYISDSAVEEAVSGRCSSFNVLDNETLEKTDLFVLQNTDFARSKMNRRIQQELPDGRLLWLSSPEDIVLQKLVWGWSSQSQKQWRDVLGVLKLQGDRLDFDYLWHWAGKLEIAEALDQAFREAGL